MIKYPFWSAIITQQYGTLTASAINAMQYVYIQPPPGETWWVFLQAMTATTNTSTYCAEVDYYDYNGSTLRQHDRDYNNISNNTYNPHLEIEAILTNSLYAAIGFMNCLGTLNYYYGYSGFEMSKPLWTADRSMTDPTPPFKRPTQFPIPDPLTVFPSQMIVDIYGLPNNPNDYTQVVILEEDTVLATDPNTGFPVERTSAYLPTSVLVNELSLIKAGTLNQYAAINEKYWNKWAQMGIKLI